MGAEPPAEPRIRQAARLILAIAYAGVGIVHLKSPEAFLPIMPDWVPAPRQVVIWTGVAELAGAIGLMVPRLRTAAALGLAAYAVCVYPANIKHAVDGVAIGGEVLGWAYHGPRLVAQPLIVWWALWAGGIIDWPFGQRERG
ncbi:DoxX family protein [Sandarakinorhabdus rubra]|uniref:DoxX family protein n=1 Tax=Sandarakinorhabdus rubra TaxID=2672568 RepID=UPI001969EDB5|nr:DoxX family protein [Sandarakinorhabdus rubra]